MNQSVAANLKKTEIINILNRANLEESDDEVEHIDTFVVRKLNKLVAQIIKLETDLEDWKRNYWSLEKKLHSQLKEDNEEIEIEFDFENNQIIHTNLKPVKNLK